VAGFRLSQPAQADLASILSTSAARWGIEAGRRYARLLAAAMRQAARDPQGRATRDRSKPSPGLRSLHLRYVQFDKPRSKVGSPVHILFYRTIEPDFIEIVRVLHERMEPSRHLG
jgi:toxin ParE1/3/4